MPLDLQRARSAVSFAELCEQPHERYLSAYLAALRVAALVLAVRGRPAAAQGRSRASGPRNTWMVLADVAPEMAEWAGLFASVEGKREAVRAGAINVVTTREADDLVRDAQTFLAVVERRLVAGERRLAAGERGPADGGRDAAGRAS